MAIKRLVKFNLPLILASAVLSMLIVLAIFDFGRQTVSEPPADQCLTCHGDERDMSAAHPNQVFGCAKCHLGNPLVAEKKSPTRGWLKILLIYTGYTKPAGRPVVIRNGRRAYQNPS
ncbi:cytochrome c3 family protein [Calditrichota bacterium GD2]